MWPDPKGRTNSPLMGPSVDFLFSSDWSNPGPSCLHINKIAKELLALLAMEVGSVLVSSTITGGFYYS
jgi:hypothetical protein